jgi:hypothetical protein
LSTLESAMKKKGDQLVESNENLNKASALLLHKEFPEAIVEAGRVWKVVCVNEGVLLRNTRIRSLQIMIEGMIEIMDLDNMPDWLQHLKTLDPNSLDTEWLELFNLVK